MTSPRSDAPARWLAKESSRRFVGRMICALILTGTFMLLIPWSVRLTQSAEGLAGTAASASPITPAARREQQDMAVTYGEIGVLLLSVAGFAVYEGGGVALGYLVGVLDDAFAGRRTQPRAAVRDDIDL